MPTYEYRCKDCGHEMEAQQAFTDDPLTVCPGCGGALRKRFGSVGISFKGSGFYKTDSRGSGSSSSSSSSTSTSGSSGSSSEGTAAPASATPADSTASASSSAASSTSPTGS